MPARAFRPCRCTGGDEATGRDTCVEVLFGGRAETDAQSGKDTYELRSPLASRDGRQGGVRGAVALLSLGAWAFGTESCSGRWLAATEWHVAAGKGRIEVKPPPELVAAVEGGPEPNTWERIFGLYTTDGRGRPYPCLLSRAALATDTIALRIVLRGVSRTIRQPSLAASRDAYVYG